MGKKAKIIDQSSWFLTAVLQNNNGDYKWGEKITIDNILGDVDLLDKRKNPEKYLKKERESLDKEIQEKLKKVNIGNQSDILDLDFLGDDIERLKKISYNNKEYEQKIQRYEKEYNNLKQKNAEHKINEIINYINSGNKEASISLGIIELYIKELKKLNIDTTKYEEQLPELKRKTYTAKINRYIEEINKWEWHKTSLELIKIYIDYLKELNINTTEYDKQLPKLEKKIKSDPFRR